MKKVLFILLCCGLSVQSQVQEILCKVIESDTRYPVSYATIQFQKSGNGVIANIDGDFRIPYQYKRDGDILLISCIGYKSKTLALSHLKDKEINVITLIPKVEMLDQVIITGNSKTNGKSKLSPEEIIQKAILSIPKNYPYTPYSKVGYYRDYQIVNGNYYNLNEAIIESFDAGFGTDIIMDDYNETAIYKYTENKDFNRDSTLLQVYDGESKYINNTTLSGQGGNELSILNIHNPIRNFEQLSFSFVYIFKKRFLLNHEFLDMKTVYLNDKPLYEISFKALNKLTGVSHKAKGKIYISKDTYGIHKFVYQVLETKSLDVLLEVEIEYVLRNAKMYLNYITFNNKFIVSDSFYFDVDNVQYDAEEKSFYVFFNSDLLMSSLDKKDFRFKFKKKKLMVEEFNVIDERTIKLRIAEWSIPEEVNTKDAMKGFEYRIKNITDKTGRKLYQKISLTAYQFREFFVQDVLSKSEKPNNVKFVDKAKPLSNAKVNIDQSKDLYWLNSPLKAITN
ncbi:carboxypeptidase-like regulatory domain-containing protein [Ichthyenterobacterium sp. W332]|uniref:Carboxypeptidase-like regulatory domain-containing protein n=1 Tax=Microcosmobacter mediterraneus TaxID=3075607 RepID=A0ABU2YME8_9FLAO|nr:carboxypeptidase-like regulatory domain-containing protein [Ichthyenterobacterium sp. W332]MDT0559339.1 carboxypeptidase-like regulatory domain-containing protein [Ichthyenterobacterium sp. W332]